MQKIYAMALIVILFPILTVNAQPIPSIPEFKEVKDKYVNDVFGIEITLPEGWSGMELITTGLSSDIGLLGGFIASPNDTNKESELPTTIMMAIFDVRKAKTTVDTPEIEPGKKPDCKVLSSSLVDIQGIKGFETEIKCTIDNETMRMKGLLLSQEEGESLRGIGITFMASESRYEQYINDFNESLKTLKVSNLKTISLPTITNREEIVIVDDTQVNIEISSSSKINNFKFNNEDKSISLAAEGEDNTIGMTDIYLGNLLKGPYTVMVNDAPTEYISIINEEGIEGIRIIYTHSIKEIKIVGTEVVPEFPITILPILATILAVSIFIARSRLSI